MASPPGGVTSGFDVGADGGLDELTGSPFSEESTAPDLQGLVVTPNQPPTSRFQFLSPATVGESVTFDAAAATDSDGGIAAYAWSFGDGESTTESDATTSHAFNAAGSYTVSLTLTDDEGCSTSLVSTGQTVYCNGSNQAVASAVIEVTDDPTPTPTPVDPDTTITDLDVTAKKKQTQKGKKIKIKLKGGAGEAVSGVAKGKIKVKKKGKKNRTVASAKNFKLKKVTKQTEAGEQTVYRLKPKKKKDTKKIFKLLGRGKDLRANPSIKFTDDAGNTATEKRVVRLKFKSKK